MDRKIRILMSPSNNYTNKYIDNLKDALNKNEDLQVVGNGTKKEVVMADYDVVLFNWLESNAVSNNALIYVIKMFAINILLIYIKLRGKKIIWTYHNKIPHESKYINLGKKVMKILYNYADIVVVHSEYAKSYCEKIHGKDNKVIMIQHPNYINNYEYIEKNKNDNKINIGFFGALRPYKGIENLITSFKSIKSNNMKLKIFGNPTNSEYKMEIENLCKDDNRIDLDLRFISDEEIPNIFSNIDVIVLPYSGESFLTSGSSMLSLSLKTPIVVPDIAMFKEYENYKFATLFNPEDKSNLKEIIHYVNKMGKLELQNLGQLGYEYAQDKSWEKFSQLISRKLKEL